MSKWKILVSGAILSLVEPCLSGKAAAEHSCIVASVHASLIGGQSDTPLMLVTINDQPAALFLSYGGDSIYVKNSKIINFDNYIDDNLSKGLYILNTFGKRENAQAITVNKFSFGGFDVARAKFILMKGVISQSVQGVPIVGIIGNTFLSNFAVLFDIKSKKIVFYEIKHECDNKEEVRKIMGGDFYEVSIHEGIDRNNKSRPEIMMTLSGKVMPFFIDPDLDATQIPVDWIHRYHIPLLQKEEKTEVRFSLDDGYISNIATVESLKAGGYTETNRKIKVADKIDAASVGLDFFADKVVLVDAVNSRIYFRKSDGVSQDPGHNLHFETSKNANIDVK